MSKTLLSLIKPRHNPKPISPLKPHLRRLINNVIEILKTEHTQWEESLEACFSESEILASDIAHHVFDRVPHPELGLKFYQWVSHHKRYHGSLNEHAYSSLLKLLAKSRELVAIESVLDTMRNEEILPNRHSLSFVIGSYADLGSVDEAVKLYYSVQNLHCCLPDVRACNSLLNALVNDGKLELARKMFDEMLERDCEENSESCVDNYSVSIVVRGLCKEGMVGEGRKMIEDRWGQGCIPNIVFYNILIDGYVKRGNLKEALELYKELKLKGFLPTVETYGTVISGFCKAGKFDMVDKLITEMSSRGLHINVNIYNNLLDAQFKHGLKVKPAETIERMTERGCEPDIVTYNTLVAASCRDGKAEEAEELLKQALERGLVPNRLTYTPLVHALCRKGQYDRFQDLLVEMVDRGQSPDLVTYGALIHGLVVNGEVDGALKVKSKMIERGVFPDARVYNALISGLCKKMRLSSATDLLTEMLSCNVAPDQYIYATLIDGYVRNGKLDEAKNIFELSISKDEGPGVVGYNCMIKGYCKLGMMKDAISCFDQMVKVNLTPDKFTYSTIIDGFGKQNDLNNALRMFGQMIKQKLKPNTVIFTSLIDGLCRGGNMDRAESLFREMESFDVEPNVVTYSVLIRGFCKVGKLTKSVMIFEEMLRNRCSPNDAAYNYLINGFSNCELIIESPEEKSLFLKMFKEMVRDGWARTSAIYNSILACLCQHSMVRDAFLLHDRLLNKGHDADPVAFTMLLNMIYLEEGEKDWKSILPDNLNQGNLQIALKYSLILDKSLNQGQTSEATLILQNLVENYELPVQPKLDAERYPKAASSLDIKGFPTLLLFTNGTSQFYTGGYSGEDIVIWTRKKTGVPVIRVNSVLEAERFLKKNHMFVVGLFDKYEGDDYEEFIKAAKTDDELQFVEVSDVEVARVLFPNFATSNNFLGIVKSEPERYTKFDGDLKMEKILQFVDFNKFPLVTKLTEANAVRVYSSPIKLQLFLFAEDDDFKKLLEPLQDVARKFKSKIMFVYIYIKDENLAKPFLTLYGLEDTKNIVVAAFDNKISSKYLLETDPTPNNIEDFCSRLLSGALSPYFKSQPIPDNAEANIKVIVGKTFDELILRSPKNILLEVYTPWCINCEATSKQVEKLAKHFKDSDNLVIARIDASANEHPKLQVSDYPTLLFYPAGDKTNTIKLSTKSSLKDLANLISKHLIAKGPSSKDEL